MQSLMKTISIVNTNRNEVRHEGLDEVVLSDFLMLKIKKNKDADACNYEESSLTV